MAVITPKLSLILLPVDLEPEGYLKIGQVILAVFSIGSNLVWIIIDTFPRTNMIKNNGPNLISQSESISALVTVIYMILLIGVTAYNTFMKIDKRNKFFKGLSKRFGGSSVKRKRSNSANRIRAQQVYSESLFHANEQALGLNYESSSDDAFGSLEQMGIFQSSKNFMDMIENMVYE